MPSPPIDISRDLRSAVVLGGGGFLGRWTVERLLANGVPTLSIGRSGTTPPPRAAEHMTAEVGGVDIAQVVEDHSADVVFHLAGPASVPASVAAPVEDLAGTVATTVSVLEGLRRLSRPPLFIYVSSAAVYGEPEQLPISESHALRPISPYGVAKQAAERYVEYYHRVHGLEVAIVRPFSVYGPGQAKQVVFDLLRRAAEADGALEVHAPEAISRDFVFAADVAEVLVQVARRAPAMGEAYNAASGRETTLGELAQTLVELLGGAREVTFDQHLRAGDPSRWVASVDKVSDWITMPTTPLRAGLEATLAWIRSGDSQSGGFAGV